MLKNILGLFSKTVAYYLEGRIIKYKNLWSDGLVVKALNFQSRGPVFKTTGREAPRSTQPFILPRSIK